MAFLSFFHRFFRTIDLFPTSKLLRYNGQTQYTTTSGGMCSAAIITVLIILFFNMGIKTVKKQLIFFSVFTENESQPSEMNFTTDGDNGLMFAVFLVGLNLSTEPKLFDITLHQETYRMAQLLSSQIVPFVQCSPSHFNYSPQLAEMYESLNISAGLCPPLGRKFTLRGKISSASYQKLRVNIQRCNSSADATCVNDATYAMYESAFGDNFELVFGIVNRNINPGNYNYKQAFFDDRNIFRFSSQLGISLNADVQSDTIETDNSLTPFTQFQTDTINHIPDKLSGSYFMASASQPSAQITIRKSRKRAEYSRTFNKLDEYLSYIGGLVGTLIGIIFIMGPYTEKSYEVSLAKKVMKDNDQEQIPSENFNLLSYFVMVVKKGLAMMGCDPNWKKTQTYIEGSQELAMQIDVTYIMRKLMFLDAAISQLMENYEIQALCMREKPTIEKLKEQRRVHFAPQLLTLHCQNISKGDKEVTESDLIRPKDNIMPSIVSTPCQMIKKQTRFEDVSALSFSDHQEDIESLKKSVRRVMQEQKTGKLTSRNILKEIRPGVLKKMTEEPENERRERNKQISIVDLESIHQSELNFEEQAYDIMKGSNIHKEKEKKRNQKESFQEDQSQNQSYI